MIADYIDRAGPAMSNVITDDIYGIMEGMTR
jgi:hypothetical protein